MMKILKYTTPLKSIVITSDDGSRFITMKFFNPFSFNCCLLDIFFMVDKIIPGVELGLSFIFFNIFYRSNKPETMKMFDEIEKELEENKSEYIDIDTFIDDLNKNKKG